MSEKAGMRAIANSSQKLVLEGDLSIDQQAIQQC
jgi:hypothetical protein